MKQSLNKTVTVKLSAEDYEALLAQADERRLSPADLARLWVKDAIARERSGQVTVWPSREEA